MNQTVNQLRLNSVKNINSLSKGNNLFRPFDKLSYKEQVAFINAHENKLLPYLNTANENTAIRNLYNNLAFVKRFGRDAFNKLSNGTEDGANIRLSMLNKYNDTERNNALLKRRGIINESFKSVFGKDQNFNEMEAGLDDQAKLSLLSNTKYLTDAQLKFQFNKDKKEIDNLNKQKSNYYSPISNPFSAVADMTNVTKPFDNAKQRQENNKNILDSLYSQVQKRREGAQDIKQLTNQYYQNLLKNDSNNKQSLATSLNNFDVLASKASGYYAQFKYKSELADYSDTDKLKDYAKFMALSSKYGTGVALSYLDHSMQDRVAKAQDWKFTGNTLKRIFTTAWSDFGGKVAMMYNASTGNLFDAEKMGLINQGLVPVYDKDGKIIGQKENTNIWTNPAYWNDVYMYNVYTPEAIRLIKERHGVSPDLNVREYGYNPNEHFISWDTLYEGISQTGHILDSVVETALLGGIGKIAGSAAGAALKSLGMGAKTLGKVSKGAKLVNNAIMDVVASTNGPQGEAMGTFNEQLENNKEATNEQIKKELHDYYNNIDYSTNEAKSFIGAIYRQLKQKDLSRLRRNAIEGGTRQLPMSDSTLMQQARQLYTNALLKKEEDRLRVKHEKDLKEAATNAARTYMTNWVMDFGKELILTHGIQQFKIAKGAKYGNLDENSISSHLIADAKTGGVKRALNNAANEIKNTGAKKLAKGIAKQVAGGFMDEYLDGINANFSEGAGTNAFKSYMNRTYNPHDYATTIQGVYGDLLAGVDEGLRGITNRENLYEGFIGGISPFVTVTPNIGNIAYHPKDTWNAVMHGEVKVGKDSNGEDIIKPINIFERAGNVITNPILDEYIKGKEKERVKDVAIDNGIETINKVVKQYKENGTIDDAAKAMAAARGYSSKSNADDNSESSFVMSAEDKKLGDAFALMSVAQALEQIDEGKQSFLYQKTMERMKGLADGTLSDKEKQEEINQFLSSPDNKSIMDNNPPEVAKLIAEERLQKNAQFFLDMYKKKQEIEDKLLSTPSFNNMDSRVVNALEYQLLAKDNWKERLRDLEDQLGIGVTNTEIDYSPNLEMIYGAGTARKTALNARIKDSERASEERLKINQDNAASNKKIEALEEQLVNSDTEDEKKEIQTKIDQEKNLIKTRDLRSKQLQVEQESLSKEVETLRQLVAESTDKPLLDHSVEFTVDRILNSDARTRAEILNPANRQRYTKKQQAIIERAINKLAEKDADALQKILDAGELAHRVEDSSTVYNTLLNDPDVAVAYFDAQEELRNRRAITESLQNEIDNNYKKIDKVLGDENSTDIDIKNTLAPMSSRLLATYMEDNPSSMTKIKPYYDLAKFDEDAASIIRGREEPNETKENRFRSLMLIQAMSKDKDELIKKIEEAIDSEHTSPDVKDFFNDLLDKMQTLGYQRDATVVETREKRKKREAEEKAKRDKEEAERKAREKTEEQAKQEAEKKTKNEKTSSSNNTEEPLVPDENNNIEVPLVPDSDSTPDEPLVPDEKNYTTEKPDIAANGEGATEVRSESVDLGGQSFINSIMDDEVEDGDVDAGEMWHKTSEGPRKGVFTINKKGNTLTFNIDGKNTSLKVSSKGYDTGNSKANNSFMATSMEKKGDDWYFNGNFAGSKEQTQVKASNDFNLESTIDEQRKSKEKLYSKQGESLPQRIVVDADGNATVRSATIEEQTQGFSEEEKKEHVANITDNTPDTTALNTVGESINENTPQVMSGNGMSEWKMGRNGDGLLDEQGILEHKKGAKEGDHMNQFYAWTEEQGWHIQNIIDQELGQILLANPKAKFKFMLVTDNEVEDNTKDSRVFDDAFLVLDYDENINRGITTLHNEHNGGVITSDGKRYLVVGTIYQRSGNNEATSRNLLFNSSKANSGVKAEKARVFGEDSKEAKDGYGVLFNERGRYIKEHPDERFFISDKYSTEVVSNSLIPGYMVKRQENDEEEVHRNLEELLNDNKRNPFGFTLKTIPIGIQMQSQFYVNQGVTMDSIMYPRNPIDSMGAAFVLFPAANDKYFCAHIDPVFYREMNDGSLKDKAEVAINKLCSVDYDTRMKGIRELSDIFYFNPDKNQNGNFILTNKNGFLTFVNKGRKEMPIKVTENLDPQVVFNAFKEMNPRVNITQFNIHSEQSLKELSKAGALNLNLAQLALAGSSYSVYGVNLDGTLDKAVDANTQEISREPYNNNKKIVIYDLTGKGDTEQFVYNTDTGKYSLNGELLNEENDSELIKQLEYNRKKLNGAIKFMVREHSNEYYIADRNTPLIVRINENTHHVDELSVNESKTMLDKYDKDNAEKEREEEANDILESLNKEDSPIMPEGAEEEFLEDYNKELTRETVESFFPDIDTERGNNAKDGNSSAEEELLTSEQYALRKSRLLGEGASSISFKDLYKTNKTFANELYSICNEKWPGFPKKTSKIEQYLKNKNIDIDNIPNTNEGIQALLSMIKNCR